MNIEQTFIKDLVILIQKIFDERGYFSKPIIKLQTKRNRISTIQDNQSFPNVE
jgi:dTDP-4-dehydrorhamnose 3,5-epimerase-like enzyme